MQHLRPIIMALACLFTAFSACNLAIIEDEKGGGGGGGTGIKPTASFTHTVSNDGFIPCTVSFTNTSQNGITYAWDFGDTSSVSNKATTQNTAHTYTKKGVYTVKLTTYNGADSAVATLQLNLKHRTFAVELGDQGIAEDAQSVIQTSDGGYFITGYKDKKSYCQKTDKNGVSQWVNTFNTGDCTYQCRGIQASDGGYIIATTNCNNGSGASLRPYAIRLTSGGTLVWAKYLGTSDGTAVDVIKNKKNEYIVFGYEKNADGKFQSKLTKMDINGTASNLFLADDYLPIGGRLIQTSDNGYAVVGKYFAVFGIGWDLFKVNTVNKEQWRNKDYASSLSSDYSDMRSVVQLGAGDLIAVGIKKSGKPYISKHQLGNGTVNGAMELNFSSSALNDVIVSTDNQLVACGTGSTFWAKIDPTTLNVLERKSNITYPGEAKAIDHTSDGGYVIVGSKVNGSTTNVYLVKTDPSGNQ